MFLITKRFTSGPLKGLETTYESDTYSGPGLNRTEADGARTVVVACHEVEPDSMHGEFDRLTKEG